MYDNPPITVSGIILKDGKLLLGKRNINPWKGSYDTIGGFVELGESLEDALKREVREETGLNALDLCYFCSHPATYNSRQILCVYFSCRVEGEIKLSDEASAVELFESVPENVVPPDKEALLLWQKQHPTQPR